MLTELICEGTFKKVTFELKQEERTRLLRLLEANISSLAFISSTMGSNVYLKWKKGLWVRLSPPRGVYKCVRALREELL